eukprot:GHVQ01015080.1.p1 GENE.GHVQ01015080.1~~GHVQ01015080.1.p1  ORF type:complete len:714 (+),score=134.20 GHVQ01015080.1:590-2731(+)
MSGHRDASPDSLPAVPGCDVESGETSGQCQPQQHVSEQDGASAAHGSCTATAVFCLLEDDGILEETPESHGSETIKGNETGAERVQTSRTSNKSKLRKRETLGSVSTVCRKGERLCEVDREAAHNRDKGRCGNGADDLDVCSISVSAHDEDDDNKGMSLNNCSMKYDLEEDENTCRLDYDCDWKDFVMLDNSVEEGWVEEDVRSNIETREISDGSRSIDLRYSGSTNDDRGAGDREAEECQKRREVKEACFGHDGGLRDKRETLSIEDIRLLLLKGEEEKASVIHKVMYNIKSRDCVIRDLYDKLNFIYNEWEGSQDHIYNLQQTLSNTNVCTPEAVGDADVSPEQTTDPVTGEENGEELHGQIVRHSLPEQKQQEKPKQQQPQLQSNDTTPHISKSAAEIVSNCDTPDSTTFLLSSSNGTVKQLSPTPSGTAHNSRCQEEGSHNPTPSNDAVPVKLCVSRDDVAPVKGRYHSKDTYHSSDQAGGRVGLGRIDERLRGLAAVTKESWEDHSRSLVSLVKVTERMQLLSLQLQTAKLQQKPSDEGRGSSSLTTSTASSSAIISTASTRPSTPQPTGAEYPETVPKPVSTSQEGSILHQATENQLADRDLRVQKDQSDSAESMSGISGTVCDTTSNEEKAVNNDHPDGRRGRGHPVQQHQLIKEQETSIRTHEKIWDQARRAYEVSSIIMHSTRCCCFVYITHLKHRHEMSAHLL